MATVTPSFQHTSVNRTRQCVWTLANGDVGAPVRMPQYPDKTVDIAGTFGAGGSVTLRGSNKLAADPTVAGDWFSITDPQANAITKTSKAGEELLENPLWISPACTAGDGTTAITVTLLGTKQ